LSAPGLLVCGGCRPASEQGPPAEGRARKAEDHSLTSDHRSAAGDSTAWPLFRGDSQATGVSSDRLPEKLDRLWTFSAAKGGFDATAAIVDGVVYIGGTGDKFYAVDLATGERRWEFPASAGFNASAAVRQGRVYVGDTDGQFHCLDAATGKEKWNFQTDGEIDSSANFCDDRVLFGSQDSYLYCLDAESGRLAWKYQSQDQIRCFATVVENLGFVAGCDGHLHVVDLRRGEGIGEVKIDSPTMASPAVLNGTVFVGTEGQDFFAIDPRKLSIAWHYQNHGHGAAFRSSAAVTPEAVIVGSRDKQLHAFNPKTGQPLWSFVAKGRIDGSPVVVGDRAFVGSADGRLYAIGVKTGEKLWQFEMGGAVSASPAVAQGRLVIGNDSGQLYCFGEKTAAEK
jgi:outer membrane protein assembly factor BamB